MLACCCTLNAASGGCRDGLRPGTNLNSIGLTLSHNRNKCFDNLMKALAFTIFLFFIAATYATADEARYVTVTIGVPAPYATNGLGSPVVFFGATNSIDIADGEVAELISADGVIIPPAVCITKDNVTVVAHAAALPSINGGSGTSRGSTVAGPAKFTMLQYYSWVPGSGSNPYDNLQGGMMTVKITPLTFSPQKTVAVAPGMGNVQITLESSTNLLTWTDATNGVYSDDLKFFRIKLTKLAP
jgi:hypothetical protein